MNQIKRATGATVTAEALKKSNQFLITDYGAEAGGEPVANTEAVNAAIRAAAEAGGGTVVVPAGEFKTYTIRLKSNVNLYLSDGAVIRAARCDVTYGYESRQGEGGNYDEPEINLYAGVQDHGHTYFANSLVYGSNLENVMICGSGLFDGSYTDEDGYTDYALLGGDPPENEYRNRPGHRGYWFGNKGIALVNCRNVVLNGFSIIDAGHFAVICEGVENLLIDSILADTTRDALDVDCCRDVTVVHSRFNSLTDDALVMKASYGAGRFAPLYNVLIEDCDVTGYDAGSVYAGSYTGDKLASADRCGPTARVKLGTESTCGYERVTVQNVRFKRSRGFALEAVDGADLRDIIFTDSTMENVSSSPIYIRTGDRARFPVTGNSTEELVNGKSNVRLDNPGWVLPNRPEYDTWPARRYAPSYNYTRRVTADGCSYFHIVDEEHPVKLNPANYYEKAGKYYEYRYNAETHEYEPDFDREIPAGRRCLYANAIGSDHIAVVENIEISNITVRDADPRYPIIIMGVDSSHVRNVRLRNIDVAYRGGLSMEHAVEQRQLNTGWSFSQFGSKPSVQLLSWMVNTFFLKNEGLLPRAKWNPESRRFVPDPYNVPELPNVYPEPSNWGILPAYGLYARHVDGLTLEHVHLHYEVTETRPCVVLDDVHGGSLSGCALQTEGAVPQVVLVSNRYKRPTGLEYVPDYPYHATDTEVRLDGADAAQQSAYRVEMVLVDAPAPGTPRDSLYDLPTAAITENGWDYEIPTDDYPLPATVYRPYFEPVGVQRGRVGEELSFPMKWRNPLTDGVDEEIDRKLWDGDILSREYTVKCPQHETTLHTELPDGAHFDAQTGKLYWTPDRAGTFTARFTLDDGVLPVRMEVEIRVEE